MTTTPPLDMLAFAPHPDDAELYCGGTLLLLKRTGRRIGIVDLTRGELSTRGDLDTRARETAEATRLLDLDYRGNCGIPDGDIANTPENRLAVAREIRRLRPRAVLVPYFRDRHPDHENASVLVRESMFAAGLHKTATTEHDGSPQEAYRPPLAYYYMMAYEFDPSFVVDVSAVQEEKLAAIRAYGTQFAVQDPGAEPQTYISRPEFLESLIGRSRRLGFHVNAEYGEGFIPLQTLRLHPEGLLPK